MDRVRYPLIGTSFPHTRREKCREFWQNQTLFSMVIVKFKSSIPP